MFKILFIKYLIYNSCKNLLILGTILVVAGAPGGALAQDSAIPAFTHATFVDGNRSMLNLIEFPDIDFDVEIEITCSGRATAKGRLRGAKCSSPEDPDLDFTMAVSRRFNASRITPGTVNGRAEEVDFQFVVSFKKAGETETIEIHPNNRKNVDRLGNDYFSAQRYSPYTWPTRCNRARLDDLLVEVAIVDSTGRAKEVNVMASMAEIPATCKTGLINQLKDGRWIPASYNGQYVDSIWVNPIVLNSVNFKRQQQP